MNALNTAIKFFQDCGLFIYPACSSCRSASRSRSSA